MSKLASKQQPEILIVQTAFLGDVLLGIPLIKNLRALYPSARMTLLCRRGVGSFFLDASLVDGVIEVDKSSSSSWRDARSRLAASYDLVICPHESFRTARFVAGVRASRKIGYARWFNRFIFTDRVSRPMDVPEALRQLALLVPLQSSWGTVLQDFRSAQAFAGGQDAHGGLVDVPFGTDMKVPSLMDVRNARHVGREAALATGQPARVASVIEPFFDSRERIAVLAPGSVWTTKKWTIDGFIEVARRLMADGFLVVVTGSRDEAELCAAIVAAVSGVASLAGRTSLYESAQLLACADVIVCNDSGAMHLAACAGTPIVTVFGPTVLSFGYRPWSSRAEVVQTKLACRPCGKHGSSVCPIGTHDCMKKIHSRDVLDAVAEVL